jgi:glycerophosphoryl diester phosphodiesterase
VTRPLVIAHRGASAERPENTIAAFERAIELGADFVELDVHARRDGALVVTHDPPRAQAAYPALEEALACCRGRIGLMVELKTPYRYRRHDALARTLDLLDSGDVFVCFEPGAIRTARRLRPQLRTIQHVRVVPVRLAAAWRCWAVGFDDRRVSPRSVRRAQALGLATTVYTVNDPHRMVELARLGVTGIFTDVPRLALETLGAWAPERDRGAV